METKIDKMDNFGRGISYHNGKICFVKGAYPGDEVSYQIDLEKKKYCDASVSNIIKRSQDRIDSMCCYSSNCGGCCFQEYDFIKENEFKERKVYDLVHRELGINDVGKIVFSNPLYYRNKIILHGNNNNLGFYMNKSHDIIKINNCIICNNRINKIIPILNSFFDIDEVLIRTSNDLTHMLIDIKGEGDFNNLLEYCDVLIVNGELFSKTSFIFTNIGDVKYRLSSESFFQINCDLTKLLYDKVLEYVKKIKPDTVLDLYCGTGSIGIYVAKYCNNIVGVDYNRSNIEDAIYNASLNKVSNARFICDRVENVIDKIKVFDLMIVDPPRSGLDNHTRDIILNSKSKYIIYVSCDPITLVRDLKILKNKYNIIEITPFNMFPRTYHCESITILERR